MTYDVTKFYIKKKGTTFGKKKETSFVALFSPFCSSTSHPKKKKEVKSLGFKLQTAPPSMVVVGKGGGKQMKCQYVHPFLLTNGFLPLLLLLLPNQQRRTLNKLPTELRR